MRLQASIGDIKPETRTDLDNNGKIALGKVTKIYEKDNTIDVILMDGFYMGDNKERQPQKQKEEKVLACRRIETFGGYDDDLKVAYGDISPVDEGDYVIIAFINSQKANPIILGTLPIFNENKKTNSPITNTGGEVIFERGERVSVNKYQDYSYMNGRGEFEKVSNSRSFFVGKRDKMSDHREDGFSYEDLTLKNKKTRKTIGLDEEKLRFQPFNYLIQTKNTIEDEEETVFTRFFHDAEKGVTRISKDKKDKLVYVEIDQDDNFEIKLQKDSGKRKKGAYEPNQYEDRTLRRSDFDENAKHRMENPRKTFKLKDSKEFTKIKIKNDGTIQLFTQDSEDVAKVIIDKKGLMVETTKSIDLAADKTISLRSNEQIDLLAPKIYMWDDDVPYVDRPLSYNDLKEDN